MVSAFSSEIAPSSLRSAPCASGSAGTPAAISGAVVKPMAAAEAEDLALDRGMAERDSGGRSSFGGLRARELKLP